MNLIGLAGRAGAGKDTAADCLVEHALVPVDRVSFASRLKISAASLFDQPDWTRWSDEFKWNGAVLMYRGDDDENPVELTGRQFLQRYGTEAHRDVFGPDFWIDALLPADFTPTPGRLLVVTDCRFPNEANRIRALGGQVWEVQRPGYTSDGHASETPIDAGLIDRVIWNDGGIDCLSRTIRAIVDPRPEPRGASIAGDVRKAASIATDYARMLLTRTRPRAV